MNLEFLLIVFMFVNEGGSHACLDWSFLKNLFFPLLVQHDFSLITDMPPKDLEP